MLASLTGLPKSEPDGALSKTTGSVKDTCFDRRSGGDCPGSTDLLYRQRDKWKLHTNTIYRKIISRPKRNNYWNLYHTYLHHCGCKFVEYVDICTESMRSVYSRSCLVALILIFLKCGDIISICIRQSSKHNRGISQLTITRKYLQFTN